MDVPASLKYSRTHEWVRVEGDLATIGITDHAQAELGDVVYVELPEPGRMVTAGDVFGTVESVKAVSDLYSPLTGEIIEANTTLPDATEAVNQDPYGAGWMVRIRMANPSELDELLTADEYRKLIEEE